MPQIDPAFGMTKKDDKYSIIPRNFNLAFLWKIACLWKVEIALKKSVVIQLNDHTL